MQIRILNPDCDSDQYQNFQSWLKSSTTNLKKFPVKGRYWPTESRSERKDRWRSQVFETESGGTRKTGLTGAFHVRRTREFGGNPTSKVPPFAQKK